MIKTSTTTKMKYYEAYKPSGMAWLGEVPAHWEMLPTRRVLKQKKQIVGKDQSKYTLLSLTLKGIIARDMEKMKGKFASDMSTYQAVRGGDFVFCLFDVDETPRTVGVSSIEGMITGAYTVFECLSPASRRFLYLYFLAMDEGKNFKPLYTGLRKTIPKSSFLGAKIPFPPLEEQEAIVRYLDHTTLKIDRAVRSKKKLIAALNEQKQAIITQAVTHGLNQDVQMKDSGVKWLGEIPAHWDLRKIKYLAKINPSSPYKMKDTHEVEFIPMENVDEIFGKIKKYNFRKLSEVSSGYTSFKNDDVIFAKITPCMENGNCALIKDLRFDIAFGSTEFIVFRADQRQITLEFLHHTLRNKQLRLICEENMRGSAGQKRISVDFLGNYLLPLPPLSEQDLIVAYVNKETMAIDKTIELTKKEIELLQEYKTRLIADAVTGAIDVRELAKDLPDIEMEVVLDDIEVDEMDDVEVEMEE